MRKIFYYIYSLVKNIKHKYKMNKLKEVIKTILDSFISVLKDEKSELDFDGVNDNDLKFTWGTYMFVLRKEINFKDGFCILRTFEIIPDNNSHGNKIEKHLTSSDILIYPNTFIRFRQNKKSVGMLDEYNQIMDFNNQYLKEVLSYIRQKEEDNPIEIDK